MIPESLSVRVKTKEESSRRLTLRCRMLRQPSGWQKNTTSGGSGKSWWSSSGYRRRSWGVWAKLSLLGCLEKRWTNVYGHQKTTEHVRHSRPGGRRPFQRFNARFVEDWNEQIIWTPSFDQQLSESINPLNATSTSDMLIKTFPMPE